MISHALVREFYQNLPPVDHSPGDIWSNIPIKTLGTRRFVNAVVITPSCDLAQEKAEVINFIPLLPVYELLYLRPFFKEVIQAVSPIFKSVGDESPIRRFQLHPLEGAQILLEILETERRKQSDRDKILEYIKYIKRVVGISSDLPDFGILLGVKNFEKILKGIVSNSYRSDMHFFPKHQSISSISIKDDSVALFRYIFSVDISIMDRANSCLPEDWQTVIATDTSENQLRDFEKYPIKLCRLKDDFLADLLARHLNMHLRFGSRDFSDKEIGNIMEAIYVSLRN